MEETVRILEGAIAAQEKNAALANTTHRRFLETLADLLIQGKADTALNLLESKLNRS